VKMEEKRDSAKCKLLMARCWKTSQSTGLITVTSKVAIW